MIQESTLVTTTNSGRSLNSTAVNRIETLELLYDKYAGAYYGEIKKRLHKDDVSQKVLHEAFNKLYEALTAIDSSKERLFMTGLKLVRKEISKAKVDIVLQQILYSKTHNLNEQRVQL